MTSSSLLRSAWIIANDLLTVIGLAGIILGGIEAFRIVWPVDVLAALLVAASMSLLVASIADRWIRRRVHK